MSKPTQNTVLAFASRNDLVVISDLFSGEMVMKIGWGFCLIIILLQMFLFPCSWHSSLPILKLSQAYQSMNRMGILVMSLSVIPYS